MIYDCIPFFNEFDLLEIRLNILAPKVDRFVILEANFTHSGKSKDYTLEEHIEDRYKDFPIEYFKLDYQHLSGNNDAWVRENAQRVMLKDCIQPKRDDIVIVSDLDEIPDPDYIDGKSTGRFHPRLYYFYLNLHSQTFYNGPYMINGDYSDQMNYQDLRRASPGPDYVDVGWHWSSLGGIDRVHTKLTSFAHTELDTDDYHAKVAEWHANKCDIHGTPLTEVPIDDTFPKYIRDNQEKYRDLIWPPSTS